MVQAAHCEVRAQIADSAPLQFFYAADAIVRVADDRAVFEDVIQRGGRLGSRPAPFVYLVMHFAAAVRESAAPQQHVENPLQMGGGIAPGALHRFGDV